MMAEILAYTNEARRSTDGVLACPEGGKYATAAGGGRKEQFCGGEAEL